MDLPKMRQLGLLHAATSILFKIKGIRDGKTF